MFGYLYFIEFKKYYDGIEKRGVKIGKTNNRLDSKLKNRYIAEFTLFDIKYIEECSCYDECENIIHEMLNDVEKLEGKEYYPYDAYERCLKAYRFSLKQFEKIPINIMRAKDVINKCIFWEENRIVCANRVNDIVEYLKIKIFEDFKELFPLPIKIANNNNKWYIIDGQHRIKALQVLIFGMHKSIKNSFSKLLIPVSIIDCNYNDMKQMFDEIQKSTPISTWDLEIIECKQELKNITNIEEKKTAIKNIEEKGAKKDIVDKVVNDFQKRYPKGISNKSIGINRAVISKTMFSEWILNEVYFDNKTVEEIIVIINLFNTYIMSFEDKMFELFRGCPKRVEDAKYLNNTNGFYIGVIKKCIINVFNDFKEKEQNKYKTNI